MIPFIKVNHMLAALNCEICEYSAEMLASYLRDGIYVSGKELHTIQFPVVFPKPSKGILH